MSTLFYSRRSLIFSVLITLISLSCRKEIDVEKYNEGFSEGAINPNEPILEEWESLLPFGFIADHIASDGQNIYFSSYSGGISRMYIMDSIGNYSALFDISANDDVQLVDYVGGKLYFTQRESNGVGKIHEFDHTGILNTYELLVSASYGTYLTSLLDVGTQLFVTGKFRIGNSGSSWSACLIDKSTGVITEMPGLGSNVINSATYFNNEIYVAARAVMGTYNSSSGRAVAKWDGNQWIGVGQYTLPYNYVGPLIGTCVGHHNGELYAGGKFNTYGTSVTKYSNTYSTFGGNLGFIGTTSNIDDPRIHMKMIENDLYLFGRVRFTNASFNSVYVMDNGVWKSIGALDGDATDLAICQGYAYAIVTGKIKKYPL